MLLAASLLIFAWASIAVVARRRRRALIALLENSPAPVIGILRAASASAAGVSAIAVGVAIQTGLPFILLLFVTVAVTAAALALVHLLVAWWVGRFPEAAGWLIRPQGWFSRSAAAPSNGDAATVSDSPSGEYADGDTGPDIPPLTPAEILNLDDHDIDMVRSISRMDDRDVQDIMVPRLDVDAVPVTASFREVVETFIATRHTRLPVYRDTMDNVVGILHVSDVLPALAGGQRDTAVEALIREPEFVAENMAVDDLLHLMRANSLQMAIVVDEYGGVEGMVTLEDVLEEIVGEIEDEFADYDEDDVPVRDADGSWRVNATVTVDAVARALGIRFDHGDVNTIGGYVYTQLGRMPAVGDVVVGDEVCIEVAEVRGRRIRQLRLTIAEETPSADRKANTPAE